MPNWCDNTLVSKKEVIDSIITDMEVDFNTVVPCPSILHNVAATPKEKYWNNVVDDASLDNSKRLLTDEDLKWLSATYGATDWYEFCNKFWGTKWNSQDTYRPDDNSVTFLTAWSPPMGFYEALSRKFPTDEIIIFAHEDGVGMHFTSTFLGGVEIFTEEIESDDEEGGDSDE